MATTRTTVVSPPKVGQEAAVEEDDDECVFDEGATGGDEDVGSSLTALHLSEYPVIDKMGGYEFYRKVLKSPRYVVAPMVDQSFIAFRTLCRRYGAELCYTPMMHSLNFSQHPLYRKKFYSTCPADRPLVVQFCANLPLLLLKAAKMVEHECDAVDINLGCPQNIAKRGNYGSFLMNQSDLVYQLVNILHRYLKVPVFCKMRVLPDPDETVKFAKMLQEAGCQMLVVHGRTKEQKGHNLGMANWDLIRRIKSELSIPVVANGNIQTFDDVTRCLATTGVDGVMSAETILEDPALFSGKKVDRFDVVNEFLDICETIHPTKYMYIRTHILQMLKSSLEDYSDLRETFGKTRTIPQARAVVEQVRQRVMTNAPKMNDGIEELRERRREARINRTEEMWDSSIFEGA